ncbi:lmo0937 family membrane protein [Fluviicola taffensis]|uniref:lmo0937 family membrane protein n=1 Tax=Fluviicola taffensis TaxID=191579 RepID=UPI0031382C50
MIMNSVLTSLAILVITGWAIGYFRYHEGGVFHLILLVGLVAIIRQLIPVRKH